MGHQNDAIAALRAYARDLESTASGGAIGRVGGSDQVDAPAGRPASGAPHQLAITAVAVCVVLIGSIAAASGVLRGRESVHGPLAAQEQTSAQPTTRKLAVGTSTVARAVMAFSARGMTRSVSAIASATESGMTEDPGFVAALSEVRRIVEESSELGLTVHESSEPLASAVKALEEAATRPPGLDPDRLPPGQGGTPPGQDPEFTPPGQDPEFTPPGQDPEFIPPGQEKPKEPAQTKNPGKGQPDRGDS